jgi:hypothetical protein
MELKQLEISRRTTNVTPSFIPNRMNVVVAATGGTHLNLQVQNNEMVDDLKRKVQQKTAIPENVQQLQYSGKILVNGTSIDRYAIRTGSTVQLTTPVNGG